MVRRTRPSDIFETVSFYLPPERFFPLKVNDNPDEMLFTLRNIIADVRRRHQPAG
jgi:hypothetical protein